MADIIGICARTGIKPVKLLIPLTIAATIGADISMIGSPGNLVANSAIQEYSGGAMSFGFFEYSKLGIPLLLGSILFLYFFGYKLIPDRDAGEYTDTGKDYSGVPAWKGKLTMAVMVLTILAMVFEKSIGIPLHISACIGAILLVITGVISQKEAFGSFEMVVVFLLAFMLPLSSAMESSGASQMLTDAVLSVAGNSGPMVLLPIFYPFFP